MFATHSSVQIHKLDKTTGRSPALHPQCSQQHQRFTTLDKIRQVQIKSWKMHNKDVRASSATVLLCRPALVTDMHAWPAWFQTTGAFCYWVLARQSLYFLSHKPPRLNPLCDDICCIFCSASYEFLGQSPSFRWWLVHMLIFKGAFYPLMFKRFIGLIIGLFSGLFLPFDVTGYYKAPIRGC